MPTCNLRRRCRGGGVCGRLESADCGWMASLLAGLEAGEMCGELRFALGNTPNRTREAGRLWFALKLL